MSEIVEGVYPEEFDERAFREKVDRLRREFPPERVKVLEAESELFHHSGNLEELLASRKFDPQQAVIKGAVFLTDIPVELEDVPTNIVARTNYPIVILDRTRTDVPFNQVRQPDTLDALLKTGKQAGFDGSMNDSPSLLVPPGTKEIIIHPTSVKAFNLHPYPSLGK